MKRRKQPTLEDVIRLAVQVQERMAREGAVLGWTLTFTPAVRKPSPAKDRP